MVDYSIVVRNKAGEVVRTESGTTRGITQASQGVSFADRKSTSVRKAPVTTLKELNDKGLTQVEYTSSKGRTYYDTMPIGADVTKVPVIKQDIAKMQDTNLRNLAKQGQSAAQQLVDSGLSWSSGTMTPENVNDLFPITNSGNSLNWKWILIGGAALLLLSKK